MSCGRLQYVQEYHFYTIIMDNQELLRRNFPKNHPNIADWMERLGQLSHTRQNILYVEFLDEIEIIGPYVMFVTSESGVPYLVGAYHFHIIV